MIIAVSATIGLLVTIATGACFFVDFRAGMVADKKIAPLYKELQFLNCQYSVILTEEQRQAALKMYKSVTQIGDK